MKIDYEHSAHLDLIKSYSMIKHTSADNEFVVAIKEGFIASNY